MGFGEHYQPAFDFYEKIRGQYGDNITLTGHSLGGNVAQRVALEYNVDNTVVYNSAPLYVNQTYGFKERLYDWVTPGESNVERIDQQRETFTGQVTRLQDEQDIKTMVLVIPSITVVIMLKQDV
ncbi:Mbeg1-like protein [Streptococcus pluranimalium]